MPVAGPEQERDSTVEEPDKGMSCRMEIPNNEDKIIFPQKDSGIKAKRNHFILERMIDI